MMDLIVVPLPPTPALPPLAKVVWSFFLRARRGMYSSVAISELKGDVS